MSELTKTKADLEDIESVDDSPVMDGSDMSSAAAETNSPRLLKLQDGSEQARERSRAVRLYLFLPIIFLTSALLGGLRLAAPDGAFVFVTPALLCLIFAVFMFALFIRGGMISIAGWFSDGAPTVQNVASGAVLLTAYAATAQVFNSLIPETGLPFWVVAFCFAWSLWNNLFADLDNKKLLRSMIALFAFAFAAKYIVLAGITAPAGEGGWLRSLIENPAKETMTWLLDLPRYTAGTGYIQFFCLALYFAGLYILPRSAR
ncbi:MAG: hypothetical protein HOP17_08745 [Acidobacteria bacterium]|nr:hypothetical protein [Acidobacteriota bacterium]